MTAAATGSAYLGHPTRMPQIDGLRAVAISMVLVHHLLPVPAWLPPMGFVGVSLFFTVSGFLITRILLDCRGRVAAGTATIGGQLRAFYARRALRLFPAYYGLLAVLWIIDFRLIRDRIGWHGFYLSNWILPDPQVFGQGGYDKHLWSLAVEEQFYLVWPFLILLLPRRGVAVVLALGIVGAIAWRAWFWLRGWPALWSAFPTPANADLLAAGGVVAWLWEHPRRPTLALVAALVGGVASTFLLTLYREPWLVDYAAILTPTAMSLCFAGLVALAADGRLPRPLAWRPVAYVGTISYGLYLVHPFCTPAAELILGRLDRGGPGVGPLAITLSLALAAASWHLYERPILSLKRRVEYD